MDKTPEIVVMAVVGGIMDAFLVKFICDWNFLSSNFCM